MVSDSWKQKMWINVGSLGDFLFIIKQPRLMTFRKTVTGHVLKSQSLCIYVWELQSSISENKCNASLPWIKLGFNQDFLFYAALFEQTLIFYFHQGSCFFVILFFIVWSWEKHHVISAETIKSILCLVQKRLPDGNLSFSFSLESSIRKRQFRLHR